MTEKKARPRRVTMHDVARLAGVSQSTVSFVVNNLPSVAPETRDRVNQAIQTLGFRVNRSAQSLRGTPNRTIGFITNQMATSPFAGQALLGAQQAAWKEGYVLLIVDAGDSADLTETAVEILIDQDVSGFIYASMSPQKLHIPLPLHDVPTVIVNADPEGIEQFPKVEAGNVQGGALAAETLLAAGHRNILYLAGETWNLVTKDREKGFRSVLDARPLQNVKLSVTYGDYAIGSGYTRIRAMIEEGTFDHTAIFAANDRVALGAMQALVEAGYSIPGDVSLLGYDDQPSLADQVHPSLTTITLPHFEMGQLAVEELLRQIAHGRKADTIVAQPRLVSRESLHAIG